MRVLVTGAAGFVGRAVVDRLARAGHDTVALVHTAECSFPSVVEVRRADVLDPTSVRAAADGIEAVCHLAALTRVRESFTDPLRYFRANVGGTLNVLDVLAGAAAPPRLVFASTAAVYGSPEVQPMGEEQAPEPSTPYAASKYAAEQAVAWQATTGRLGAVVLRVFNAAGASAGRPDPDLSRVIPKAVAVAAGREAVLEVNGDGTAVRDFVHVEDLATAFALGLDACEPGRASVYNVGSTPASVADVVASVERIAGTRLAVRHLPPKPEPQIVLGDTTRIRSELGWNPEQSDLDRIVRDAWNAETGANR